MSTKGSSASSLKFLQPSPAYALPTVVMQYIVPSILFSNPNLSIGVSVEVEDMLIGAREPHFRVYMNLSYLLVGVCCILVITSKARGVKGRSMCRDLPWKLHLY